MTGHQRAFVPAAGHDWLLPLYDPLQKLLGADAALRQLIEQASLEPGHRLLDIGCGTGSLAVLVGRLCPGAEIVGLDPDPKALARARRKARRAGVAATFDEGYSEELPYPDASFHRVLSSFMIHHLGPEEKVKTMLEVRRVLAPGGSLHVLDFGGSGPRRDGLIARLLHGHEHVHDAFEGGLPALMTGAGLMDAREVGHRSTLFGRVAFCSASVPEASPAG